VDGEQVGACCINASEYECSTYVTLVPAARPANILSVHTFSNLSGDALEEPLLEHGHRGDNTGFAASGEGMQFNITRDERSDKFRIRCRASATASDGLANIMNLCFGSPISHA